MYVCICKAVTDQQIRRARSAGAETLEDVREALGVTSGCGSCTSTVEAILQEPDGQVAPAGPRLYVSSAA